MASLYSMRTRLKLKPEENQIIEASDFIVVGNFDMAEDLLHGPVIPTLQGKAILVAYEGVEFLTIEDLDEAIKAKKKQNEKSKG